MSMLLPWTTRPRWDEPCDRHGNPINPDGTIQVYVLEGYSSNAYIKKDYKMKFGRHPGKKMCSRHL